jgi:hypothetical protein
LHVITTNIPQQFKIQTINSSILERSQKFVIDKIEVKMLAVKIKMGILNCHKQEFRDFSSNSLLF